MQTDIKCAECGKVTRKFELGRLFYRIDKPSQSLLVEDSVVCPKCKVDIGTEKFMIKENDLLMSIVAANLSRSIGPIPKHLQGALAVDDQKYRIMKQKCKSRPTLVSKF